MEKGMIFKNYKELCAYMGWVVGTGTQKKAQLKELDTICEWHKEGNKIVIDEVFEEKKKKVDKRASSSKYINPIEVVLLYSLKNKEGEVYLSTTQLAMLLEMFNENFNLLKDDIYKIADDYRIEVNLLKSFAVNSRAETNKIIRRALKSMKSNFVIDYIQGIVVVTKDGKKRIGTTEEIKTITRIKNEELKIMGFHSVSSLTFYNKTFDFNKRVKNRLEMEGLDYIDYFFDGYVIISHNKTIAEEIDKKKKEIEALNLNISISERMREFALNRHEKALKSDKDKTRFGEPLSIGFESSKIYLKSWDRAIEIFIKK